MEYIVLLSVLHFAATFVSGKLNSSCHKEEEEHYLVVEGCKTKRVKAVVTVCTDLGTAIEEGHMMLPNVSQVLTSALCYPFPQKTSEENIKCYDGYQDHLVQMTTLKILNYTPPANCRQKINVRHEAPAEFYLYKYIQPCIVVAGIVGNVLSFIVMSSKYMKQFSFSAYLKTLAVLDSITLLHYWMVWGDSLGLPKAVAPLRASGYSVCMIYPYVVRVCQLSSAWILAAFNVDRSVTICRPFLAQRHINPFRVRLLIAVLIICVALSQLYHPLHLKKDIRGCFFFSFPPFIKRIGDKLILVAISRFVLLFLLPFIVISGSNTAILISLNRSRQRIGTEVSACDTSNDLGRNSVQQEQRISIRLMSVSVSYLVLFLPDAVLMFLDLNSIVTGDGNWYANGRGFRAASGMIFSLNFAINYLLYGFAFRKHALLCSKTCSKRRLASKRPAREQR